MTNDDLQKILADARESGAPANLQSANLQGANLQGANLQGANLQGANLWGADLRGANLRGAYLQGANLQGANLQGANLQGANLWGADLRGANLRGAYLQGANLQGANLQGANLQGAYLQGANLQGADLQYGLKVSSLCLTSGSYFYISIATVSDAGIPWVRMGCLWKTVSEWDAIGVKQSNISEFPDDGSEKSEERAYLFEFTRALALRMAERFVKENQS